MNSIFSRIRAFFVSLGSTLLGAWRRYRALGKRTQIAIAVVAVILIISIAFALRGGTGTADQGSGLRTVTLESVGSLSGASGSTSILGSVRSVTEAELLAQSGGAVTAVHTTAGASVPAGFIIAELENSVQAAQVLSAEGAYQAAAASAQSVDPALVTSNGITAYQSAYASLDSILKTYVDTVFGTPLPYGPLLLIDSHSIDPSVFSQRRQTLDERMKVWNTHLAGARDKDPGALLSEANTIALSASTFINDLTATANERNSNATAAQLSALSTARSSMNTLLGTISSAIASYRSQSQAGSTDGNATVKQALGALRLAQATYEKTIIRAPISGTVNFLPIHTGDYVSLLQHVATVAQNGALEIVAQVTEDDRATLTVGTKVTIDGNYPGIVTSIAPALDPVTKQIEVRIAVSGTTALVNGQSVRIALPAPVQTITNATSTSPLFLPLASVKLTATNRVVFTAGTDNRLIAVPVEIGDVRGDRIEIRSTLPLDTKIVTDARGLSEGERVSVATSTP